MGVHDLDRYDEVRSALGIPEGEPLFVIRAKDELAVRIVEDYRRTYVQQALIDKVDTNEIDRFAANLDRVILEFLDWRLENEDQMKLPD
jgi:hypothetical protein